MIGDKLLLWRFKRGDREALADIYRKYKDYLLRIAVTLSCDTGTAEDVVHDVFLSFTCSSDKLELDGSLKSFLATCVINRYRDIIRKRQRHRNAAVGEVEDGPASRQPDEWIIRTDQLTNVNNAMRQLPNEQREVVVMRVYGDMRFRAIAECQNVSINTVQSRYRYALDRLQLLLKNEVKK